MSSNYLYRLADTVGMTLKVSSNNMISGSKNIKLDHVLPGAMVSQNVLSSVMSERIFGVLVGVGRLNVAVMVGLSTKSLTYMVITSLTETEAQGLFEKHTIKEDTDVLRVLGSSAKLVLRHERGQWIAIEKS